MNFDTFYAHVFGERWPILKEALSKPSRPAALINKYADPSLIPQLLNDQKESLVVLPFISIPCLAFSDYELLFPAPPKTRPCPYYLMDAASLLPVEALDIFSSASVLDMCSAPGGKTVAILQHLITGRLTANEFSKERLLRLKNTIHSHLPKDQISRVTITHLDATRKHWDMEFDRVLLDAPCSTDRHVLRATDEQAKWSAGRLKLDAERQYSLLLSALHAVVPDGLVVYATCSISEIQNDAVIDKLLKKKHYSVQIIKKTFGIGEPTRHGWMVLPDRQGQWGPLYFCIIQRKID